MFVHTIDTKKTIKDIKGNDIIDLTPSIFSRYSSALEGYRTIKMDEVHEMRPDKVSFDVYGDTNYTEMVLKYSGISNPFSLDRNDIIMLPEMESIHAQTAKELEDETEEIEKSNIKNYYKFSNNYNPDKSSYDDLANKVIESGVKENKEEDYMVPYISDDGATAITIRNGRMYFGEDAGPSAANNMDEKIQNLINQTASAIADQCALNGLSLTDFVRASTKNS